MSGVKGVIVTLLLAVALGIAGAYASSVGKQRTAVGLTSAEQSTADLLFRCTVTGVHDGDGPIYCAEGEKIRLTAVAAKELDDTCSPGHPCPSASGADAKAALTELVADHVLTCERTGTSYSRVTAWCWRSDGVEVNCAMVESGKALPWRKWDPDRRMCRQPAPTVVRSHA